MKRKIVVSVILLTALVLSLAGCAGAGLPNTPGTSGTSGRNGGKVENVDGEIKSSSLSSGDAKYGVAMVDAEAEAASTDVAADASYPAEPGGLYDGGVGGAPRYDDQTVYGAGTLTAGEWRDNANYADWKDKFQQSEWTKLAEKWNVPTLNRVAVTVAAGDSVIGEGAKVRLLDAKGNVLYRAVSDNRGVAYLFAPTGSRAASVEAEFGGEVVRADCEGVSEVRLSFNLRYEPTARKLDLMLMVDTTGSMSDELEYLKAELKDVVERAQSESGVASVRTSVNFYRDEGDEYVVRYFGFRDSIDEAVAKLSEQHAAGGGDMPEAVHTALDNAVNQHAWDEGSIKLMFLVLDAPPHYNDEVVKSINESLARAAEMGIRIIPVVASGSDLTCEVLFRSMAVLTGGTYAFLTDDSGIGYPHSEPQVGEYDVEKLNDLMVRIISEYCA